MENVGTLNFYLSAGLENFCIREDIDDHDWCSLTLTHLQRNPVHVFTCSAIQFQIYSVALARQASRRLALGFDMMTRKTLVVAKSQMDTVQSLSCV